MSDIDWRIVANDLTVALNNKTEECDRLKADNERLSLWHAKAVTTLEYKSETLEKCEEINAELLAALEEANALIPKLFTGLCKVPNYSDLIAKAKAAGGGG